MKALLWKDWRLVRPLLIAAAVLYLSPTVIYAIAAAIGESRAPRTTQEWIDRAVAMCVGGLGASLLACPLFSAVMLAKERRERTAELTATLPVSRLRVVTSKALVCLAAAAIPWMVTAILLVVLVLCGSRPAGEWLTDELDGGFVLIPLSFALMGLGLGWLFSAILRSETLAAGLSVLLTTMTGLTTALVINRLHPEGSLGPGPFYVVALTTAAIAAAAGTITALCRRTT